MSWLLKTEEKGKVQRAYRILAASSEAVLVRNEGDLWDTGKTRSTSNYLVFYKGEKPLQSGQQVFWKVQVWDEKDGATPWSAPAHFTMGLLGAGDWKAEWIAFKDETPLHRNPAQLHLPPPRYYRKDFGAGKKIKEARLLGTQAVAALDPLLGKPFTLSLTFLSANRTLANSYHDAYDEGHTLVCKLGEEGLEATVLIVPEEEELVGSLDPGEVFEARLSVLDFDALYQRPVLGQYLGDMPAEEEPFFLLGRDRPVDIGAEPFRQQLPVECLTLQ